MMRLVTLGLLFAGAAGCTGATQQKANPAPVVAPVATATPEAPTAEADPLDEDPPTGKDGDLLNMAVARMDEGQLNGAIRVLEALKQRHPNNGMILHELALAYRVSRRPAEAVSLLLPYRPRLGVMTLASLASAMDEAGKPKDAIALLREEIPRHPTSGLLHSELATTLLNSGKRDDALGLYEKSIQVEPAFAPGYMHLAQMYATTPSKGLTLLHGETFRVLEPRTERSERIAVLMVRVCDEAGKTAASGGGTTSSRVSLAPDVVATKPDEVASLPIVNQFERAFGPGLATAHTAGLSLASLHGARRAFLDVLKGKSAPTGLLATPLVKWLRALDSAGHLEAYDYWLYGPADPAAQGRWFAAHTPQLDAMALYLATHPLYPREPDPGRTPSNVTASLDRFTPHERLAMY